jgi:hypothetical protein
MLGAASRQLVPRNLYPAPRDSSHKARLLVKKGRPVRASGTANAGTTHNKRQQQSNALARLCQELPATAETAEEGCSTSEAKPGTDPCKAAANAWCC